MGKSGMRGRRMTTQAERAQMQNAIQSAAGTPPPKTEGVDVNWPKVSGREWDQPSRG